MLDKDKIADLVLAKSRTTAESSPGDFDAAIAKAKAERLASERFAKQRVHVIETINEYNRGAKDTTLRTLTIHKEHKDRLVIESANPDGSKAEFVLLLAQDKVCFSGSTKDHQRWNQQEANDAKLDHVLFEFLRTV